jgi:hypothetical protein
MIVSLIYLDKPGWTVHQDLSTFNDDSFGAIVPELKKAIMRLKADKVRGCTLPLSLPVCLSVCLSP